MSALPGLEHPGDGVPAKTSTGYLTHLAGLDYGDGWTFWALTMASDEPIARQRRLHRPELVETVWLVRGHQLRLALVEIATGRQVAHIDRGGWA
jgi:hypothetical protein